MIAKKVIELFLVLAKASDGIMIFFPPAKAGGK
jgi:hypothetical protein